MTQNDTNPATVDHPRTGELVVDPPQIRVTVKGLAWLHQHLAGTARGELTAGGAA